jgi:hypothetical protein
MLLTASVVACLAAAAAAQEKATTKTSVPLDRVYIDPINGYSLKPPAGTERKKETNRARLVSWIRRDATTNAIVWTLSVGQVFEQKDELDLDVYAKALAERLKRDQLFEVSKTTVGKLADKPAIDLVGNVGEGFNLYQRQVWVLAEPNRFLVFMISGPRDGADALTSIMDAVLGTLDVKDREKELRRRKENLKAGQEFLEDLKAADVKEALDREARWYLLSVDGKYVGFKRSVEEAVRKDKIDGVEIRSHVLLNLPGQPQRLLERTMFVSDDRKNERWEEWLQVGSGRDVQQVGEVGLRVNEAISVDMAEKSAPVGKPRQTIVPTGLRAGLLPRALGELLPRLVDLDKAASYAFGSYNSQTNRFDMRTLSVKGQRELNMGDKRVKAVLVEDQVAADVEATTLYVDGKGRILLLQTPEGLSMQLSSRQQVLNTLPKAEAVIRALDKQ